MRTTRYRYGDSEAVTEEKLTILRNKRNMEIRENNVKSCIFISLIAAVILFVFGIAFFYPYRSPTPEAGYYFLRTNENKRGVKTTASGLQYKIIQYGDFHSGKPSDESYCTCTYKGTLIDGRTFDEAEGRVFKLNSVISGWREALKMMHKGSEWEIYLPAKLAYGRKGRGHLIIPGSVLVFRLTLVDFIDEQK